MVGDRRSRTRAASAGRPGAAGLASPRRACSKRAPGKCLRSRSDRRAGKRFSARTEGSDGAVALQPADRCLQYRALFESDNGDRYPTLEQVTITLPVAVNAGTFKISFGSETTGDIAYDAIVRAVHEAGTALRNR